MKAFYLALLFLCLNIGIGLANLADIYDTQLIYNEESIDGLETTYDNLNPYSKPLDDDTLYKTEDPEETDRGISLWESIKMCIFPNVLLTHTFHINDTVANMITIPIILIYIIGLAQLFRGIGGKTAI